MKFGPEWIRVTKYVIEHENGKKISKAFMPSGSIYTVWIGRKAVLYTHDLKEAMELINGS